MKTGLFLVVSGVVGSSSTLRIHNRLGIKRVLHNRSRSIDNYHDSEYSTEARRIKHWREL